MVGLNHVYRISRRALLVWELFTAILWLIPAGALIVFSRWMGIWWHVAFWPWLGVYFLAALCYLPVLYRSTQYELGSRRIMFEKGVFFHHKHYMSRERIVFVTVRKSPLTPLFGLSSLQINATGGRITIPFLNNRTAWDLAKELSPHQGDMEH